MKNTRSRGTIPEVSKAAAEYRAGFLGKLKRNPGKGFLRVLRRKIRESRFVFPWKAPDGPGILPVPAELRPPSYSYAGKCGGWFEEYYFKHWTFDPERPLIYLPIFWDHFFFQSQAGSYLPNEFKGRYQAVHELLDSIRDDGNFYFTVLGMYDFPIWDWHRFPRNVCVFGCAGTGDITLPLLRGERSFSPGPKSHHVSFMGNLDGFSDSTGIRSRMHRVLDGLAHFGQGPDWENVMRSSTYSLAPRGLGPTSFRLYEAISLGSIPIYIWNEKKALPFEDEVDWSQLAVVRHEDELPELRDWLLSDESRQWAAGREPLLREFHETRCNYEAIARYVDRTTLKLHDRTAFKNHVQRPELSVASSPKGVETSLNKLNP